MENDLKKFCAGLTDAEKRAHAAAYERLEEKFNANHCEEVLRNEGPDSTNAKKYCPTNTIKQWR